MTEAGGATRDDGHEHCGHPIGAGTSRDTDGTVVVRCCRCGIQVELPWTRDVIPIRGHGSHVGCSAKVHRWPKGWKGCAD
jgi:hypothetical protein